MAIRDIIQRRGGERMPVRRSEDRNLFSLQREINDLFNDFFGDFGLMPFGRGMPGDGFAPAVDISESDKEIRVSCELPGVDEKDVKIEVDDYGLTISGEKKSEREEKGPSGYRCERTYGAFHRVVPLPARVDASKAKAEFKAGVLSIDMPKLEQERKRVEIKIE